jgi:class 3 adenylate cyclase
MTAPVSTFVFGDLVGWTTLMFEHGDARGAELALGFRRRATLLLRDHCACEVKGLGDGVMLRCEDPAQAIRLGLGLLGYADAPVRVGMQTGPAVECDGDWYGTTVNVAARLCAAAQGGEVLVGEDTLRGAGPLDGIVYGVARLHRLHNVPRLVAARRVRPEPRRFRRCEGRAAFVPSTA